ncbi:MAG TPA: formyltetrahydrofolate deformylase [Polyangiaceae bacterium]|nr:formyltetrahydrofolate deformylase [Polyangiaceae bacterium]
MKARSREREEAQLQEMRRASGVIKIERPDPALLSAIAAHADAQGNTNAEAQGEPNLSLRTGPNTATLLVACEPNLDLSYLLSQAFAACGARVIESEQYTHPNSARWFLRMHADTSRMHHGIEALSIALGTISRELGLIFHSEHLNRKKRVALFVSKYDHCLYDLLFRHDAGELDCEIPLIMSNHRDLEPVAKQFGVPFQVVPKTAANKAEAEDLECGLLAMADVDLVVLARYMQIMSREFVTRFSRRVINIHHSFLPAFIGGKPYHQAHERGVKLIGATAHYATANLDEGPIIEQDVVRCTHKDSVEDLVRKGRDLERLVLARAVRLHLEDRVIVEGNKTVIFD